MILTDAHRHALWKTAVCGKGLTVCEVFGYGGLTSEMRMKVTDHFLKNAQK